MKCHSIYKHCLEAAAFFYFCTGCASEPPGESLMRLGQEFMPGLSEPAGSVLLYSVFRPALAQPRWSYNTGGSMKRKGLTTSLELS